MGTISTGVGLISGFPTADVIDQLIAIESRPLDLVSARIAEIQTQRTAFLELNARILAVQNAASLFSKPSFFRSTT